MIAPDTLASVGHAIQHSGCLGSLRQQFPALHFSECHEDDVSPRYRRAMAVPGFALFYISGASGHCLEMTNDAQIATGILVATVADDE